ncbi:helix-turn-helix domain-containing protein [Sutcliffiella horikoshii]|uniref:helix-turn-helix domain-containing protein n=1 Tax=Sutcliffiella horikoshii TaxID=79883 RepID=UPI003CEA441C
MFPERLTQLRKNKNLSKTFMGELLGITRQAYSKYEEDKSEPDIKTINKLASFFDVPTDYLLGSSDSISLDRESENESLFFFDKENITPEEMEELKKYLEFMRMKAKQENEKKD